MPIAQDKSYWTDDRVAFVRERVNKGHSAGAIAWDLSRLDGRAITRNAVISKIHRSGMRMSTLPGVRKPRAKGATRPYVKRIKIAPPVAVVEVPRPARMEEVAASQRRSLLELTNCTCRWPYGDVGTREFFFCGAPADLAAGQPYCASHALQASRRGNE